MIKLENIGITFNPGTPDVGSGHKVAKTVQWTVFSESPSSCAAKA